MILLDGDLDSLDSPIDSEISPAGLGGAANMDINALKKAMADQVQHL